MTIEINSTTDSKEAVTTALGDLAKTETVVETQDAKETKSETKATEEQSLEVAEDAKVKEPSESAPEDESEDELAAKKEDEAEESKPNKKTGIQRRFDKITRQKAELEREKDYWKQEALKTKPSVEKIETTTVAKDFSGEPKTEDFETHDAYVRALTRWEVKQELAAEKQKLKDDSVKTEIQTKLNTHQTRVDAFKAEHDDFEEVLENCAGIEMTPVVRQAIVESDLGPQLMYALGNDTEEYKRICSLPYGAAMREMGKLEAKFSKNVSKTSSETTTTKAPTPITPVRPRGAAMTKDINDPTLSQRDYEAAREKQFKQNAMRR